MDEIVLGIITTELFIFCNIVIKKYRSWFNRNWEHCLNKVFYLDLLKWIFCFTNKTIGSGKAYSRHEKRILYRSIRNKAFHVAQIIYQHTRHSLTAIGSFVTLSQRTLLHFVSLSITFFESSPRANFTLRSYSISHIEEIYSISSRLSAVIPQESSSTCTNYSLIVVMISPNEITLSSVKYGE